MTDGELARLLSKYLREKNYVKLENIMKMKIEENLEIMFSLLLEVVKNYEEIVLKDEEGDE